VRSSALRVGHHMMILGVWGSSCVGHVLDMWCHARSIRAVSRPLCLKVPMRIFWAAKSRR
jgi:hypothetical protein